MQGGELPDDALRARDRLSVWGKALRVTHPGTSLFSRVRGSCGQSAKRKKKSRRGFAPWKIWSVPQPPLLDINSEAERCVEVAPSGIGRLKGPSMFFLFVCFFPHSNNPFVSRVQGHNRKSRCLTIPWRSVKWEQAGQRPAAVAFWPGCYWRCLLSGPRGARPEVPPAWRRGWRRSSGDTAPLSSSGRSSSGQGAPPHTSRIRQRKHVELISF